MTQGLRTSEELGPPDLYRLWYLDENGIIGRGLLEAKSENIPLKTLTLANLRYNV